MKNFKPNNLKNVIITGASKGIGRATAELFASQGYNVLIGYNNSKKSAFELCDMLADKGLSAKTFKADVSEHDDVSEMMKFCADEFGSVDILVNNAGISQDKLFTDITDADFDNMINVNLKSVFYCCREALCYMIPRKTGKIINISSIWGITGASCEVHYSASKAAVIGLTKALAKELGPSGIQVNCVAPGVIVTDMLSAYSQVDLDVLKNDTPLMRLGTPEDIAGCILYLASSYADFITGQVISPNGGFVI